jgi:putative glycerol-1-phosphate prenyltransferase
MISSIYPIFEELRLNGSKLLIPLIDPDKTREKEAELLGHLAEKAGLPVLLVGGSLITNGSTEETIRGLKTHFGGKIVLFPGHAIQVCGSADGILFLSLISGRNSEYLIGQHVTAAPMIKQVGMEVIPTGYLLISGGSESSAAYMTQTQPIPREKAEIAAATALAGEMLGLKCTYLEAGSGANRPIPEEMIQAVRNATRNPLIVGGGIRSVRELKAAWKAGADAVVVGNILEKEPEIILAFAEIRQNG